MTTFYLERDVANPIPLPSAFEGIATCQCTMDCSTAGPGAEHKDTPEFLLVCSVCSRLVCWLCFDWRPGGRSNEAMCSQCLKAEYPELWDEDEN